MEKYSSVTEKVRAFERLTSKDAIESKTSIDTYSKTTPEICSSGDLPFESRSTMKYPLFTLYRDSQSVDLASDASSFSDADRCGQRSISSFGNMSRFSSSDIVSRCNYHTNHLKVEVANLRDEFLFMIKRGKNVANAANRQAIQISTLCEDIVHSNKMYSLFQTSKLLPENKISTPYRYINQDINETLRSIDNRDFHSFHKDFVINSTFRTDNY